MEEETYYLVLTGEITEGYGRDEAQAALGRLLRMPSAQAGLLLQGKPARIQKVLEKEKAQHLMGKVLTCGVECRLMPAKPPAKTIAEEPRISAGGVRGRPLGRPKPEASSSRSTPAGQSSLELEYTDGSPATADAALDAAVTATAGDHSAIDAGPGGELPSQSADTSDSRASGVSVSPGLSLELEPVEAGQGAPEAMQGAAELPATKAGASELTLELEQPDPELEQAGSDEEPEIEEGQGGIAAAMSEIVLESPAPLPDRAGSAGAAEAVPEGGGKPARFYEHAAAGGSETGPKAEKKSAGAGKWLVLVLAALLIAAGGWAGLRYFMTEEKALPVADKSPQKAPAAGKKPLPSGPAGTTRTRQEMLARSVKIWMIQYGAGFDPGQVTLTALEQDLQIRPEELLDGWGTRFRYQPREGSYAITSAGPDRQFDTSDDVEMAVELGRIEAPGGQ